MISAIWFSLAAGQHIHRHIIMAVSPLSQPRPPTHPPCTVWPKTEDEIHDLNSALAYISRYSEGWFYPMVCMLDYNTIHIDNEHTVARTTFLPPLGLQFWVNVGVRTYQWQCRRLQWRRWECMLWLALSPCDLHPWQRTRCRGTPYPDTLAEGRGRGGRREGEKGKRGVRHLKWITCSNLVSWVGTNTHKRYRFNTHQLRFMVLLLVTHSEIS